MTTIGMFRAAIARMTNSGVGPALLAEMGDSGVVSPM